MYKRAWNISTCEKLDLTVERSVPPKFDGKLLISFHFDSQGLNLRQEVLLHLLEI